MEKQNKNHKIQSNRVCLSEKKKIKLKRSENIKKINSTDFDFHAGSGK
jgi:hypothetical protein